MSGPKVCLSFFKDVYSQLGSSEIVSWGDVCDAMSQHLVCETKEEAFMFNLTSFDKPQRIGENVEGIWGMILDYDKGQSLEQAIEKVDYACCGYTSFKHGVDGLERFRIILPFCDPCTAVEWSQRRKDMLKWAARVDGLDESCLSLVRAFYVPSCPEKRLKEAFSWKRNGPVLDWRIFKKEPPYIPIKTTFPEFHDDAKATLLDELHECYLGYEPDWHKVGLAMASNGFDFGDFCHVSIGGLMNQKGHRECEKKWKHIEREIAAGKSLSKGVLFNIIKEKLGHPPKALEESKYHHMREKYAENTMNKLWKQKKNKASR